MPEQRKTKRFEIQFPLELVRSGSDLVSQTGETKNMSSSGVLFTSETEVAVGEVIEYLVTLPSAGPGAQIRLRCMGKVVRNQPLRKSDNQRVCIVAATLERYEFVRDR